MPKTLERVSNRMTHRVMRPKFHKFGLLAIVVALSLSSCIPLVTTGLRSAGARTAAARVGAARSSASLLARSTKLAPQFGEAGPLRAGSLAMFKKKSNYRGVVSIYGTKSKKKLGSIEIQLGKAILKNTSGKEITFSERKGNRVYTKDLEGNTIGYSQLVPNSRGFDTITHYVYYEGGWYPIGTDKVYLTGRAEHFDADNNPIGVTEAKERRMNPNIFKNLPPVLREQAVASRVSAHLTSEEKGWLMFGIAGPLRIGSRAFVESSGKSGTQVITKSGIELGSVRIEGTKAQVYDRKGAVSVTCELKGLRIYTYDTDNTLIGHSVITPDNLDNCIVLEHHFYYFSGEQLIGTDRIYPDGTIKELDVIGRPLKKDY